MLTQQTGGESTKVTLKASAQPREALLGFKQAGVSWGRTPQRTFPHRVYLPASQPTPSKPELMHERPQHKF